MVDADLPNLARILALRWYVNSKGYVFAEVGPRTGRGRRTARLHQVVLGLEGRAVGRAGQVDHLNHDLLDNRRANLRPVTPSENTMNRRVGHTGTSRYRGVSHHRGRWRARLRYGHTAVSIGIFDTERDAALAYDVVAVFLLGVLAQPNFEERARYQVAADRMLRIYNLARGRQD